MIEGLISSFISAAAAAAAAASRNVRSCARRTGGYILILNNDAKDLRAQSATWIEDMGHMSANPIDSS